MYDTILKLSSYEECCDFFDDLCTGKELEALEQRYEVARMLAEGKVYMDIMKEMGMTRMNVTYTLGQSLKKLRTAFGTGDREFRVNRFCRTEGNEAKGNIK